MKQLNHLLLGAALLLAPLASTLAQSTWDTTDTLAPYAGRAVVADVSGDFFTLSISTNSTSPPVYTLVGVSSDTGLTWNTVGAIPGYALKLAAAPDGTLFASGNRSATVSGRGFIWYSTDHGTTWIVSNPWPGNTNTVLQPGAFMAMDVAAGNSGTVYVGGYIYAGLTWVVRKGQLTAGGIAWSTVGSFPGIQLNSIFVRPGAAGQTDDILVCGTASNSPWIVRHSSNGGATWAIIDNYSGDGNPDSVTAGPDGSIYVLGGTLGNGWLVRKSSNGGATWANVDFIAKGLPAFGRGITVDAFGRIFAIGSLNNTWLVRASVDGGRTWGTTDPFAPAGYSSAAPWGVASDALGNLCVIGTLRYWKRTERDRIRPPSRGALIVGCILKTQCPCSPE